MPDTHQQWFKDAKFGLFIHWGLYALLAGEYKGQKTEHIAEWIMHRLDIPVAEYEKLAAQFNPVDFDPEMIAAKAKSWGMKYIVLTSKHHDGFALYDSAASDYNVVKATPYGKDIVRQLKDACDRHGLKLGLYYSQAQDWHDPNGVAWLRDNSKKDFQKYLDEKAKPQLREILTQYGDLGLIWFDTPLEMTPTQSKELAAIVKELQPNCIISGRIGNGLGEYMTTADNFIPRLPYAGDWEVPATLNDTWGFNKFDTNWKTPEQVIRLLLKITARGGNYLLNIGPDALGNVPKESLDILDTVGTYVTENSEAIHGSERIGHYHYETEWGELTVKPHRLYVHVFSARMRVELLNVANKVTKARLLKDGRELEFELLTVCEGDSLIEVHLPVDMHDASYYCVCLELEEEAPIFEEIRA